MTELSSIHQRFPKRSLLWVALPSVLLLVTFFLLPPGAVWVTDNGNKYIQMRSFAETGSTAVSHPLPEFFPSGGFHFRFFRGAWRSFLPDTLPVLSAWSFRLLGERGAGFWPLLAMLGLLLLFHKWRRDPLLTFLLLAGTPLWFYSALLWEMTPSVFFAFAGTLLLLRGKFFAAGAVLGCGVWMREELYLYAGCAMAALCSMRDFRSAAKLAAGFGAGVLPVWIVQYCRTGYLLGLHGAFYHANNAVKESLLQKTGGVFFNCYQHLVRFDSAGRLSALFGLPAAAAVLWGFSRKQVPLWLLRTALAGNAVLLVYLFRAADPLLLSGTTMGILSATPLLWGFFFHGRKLLTAPQKEVRLLTRWYWCYLLLVPPLLTRTDIGLTWGARHFLVLLPAALALSRLGWGGTRRKFFLLTALFGIGMQFFSIMALNRVSRHNAAIENAIRAAGEKVVLSDVFFLPEQTPRLLFEQLWIDLSRAPEKIPELLEKEKIDRFVLVLSPRYRRIDDASLRRILEYAPLSAPPELLQQGKEDVLSLFIGCCRRKTP